MLSGTPESVLAIGVKYGFSCPSVGPRCDIRPPAGFKAELVFLVLCINVKTPGFASMFVLRYVVQVEQSQMSLTRKKVVAMIKTIPVMTWDATKALVLFVLEIIKNPRVLKDKLAEAQYHLKEVSWHHRRTPGSPNSFPCRIVCTPRITSLLTYTENSLPERRNTNNRRRLACHVSFSRFVVRSSAVTTGSGASCCGAI